MNKHAKYFTLQEFLDSSVARQKGISNSPSWEVVEHLLELALFLDELREAWGSGILVSSGFRNEKLNDAVGGVKNSVHKIGYAADIQPVNGHFDNFVAFIKDWARRKSYDQIIVEKKGNKRWVHVGLRDNSGKQRKQLFNINL